MFQPGEIIYGFAKNLYRPKNKYAISLYRDENVNILIQFTTSQDRAGVPFDKIVHGANYLNGDCMSYVFEPCVEIGVNPETGESFSFPKRTVMVFDYGYLQGSEQFLLNQFSEVKTLCKLHDQEYINLVYAMYKSSKTNKVYIPYLERILTDYYSE